MIARAPTRALALALAVLAPAALVGCDPEDDGGEEEAMDELEPQPGDPDFVRDPGLDMEVVSEHGSERSAGMVGNCMQCHQPRGPGMGQFTLAGTAVDDEGRLVPDPIVELRRPAFDEDGPVPGELVATIEGDRLGNFYTTEPLPWPDESLVPWVFSSDRTLANNMPFGTISGACNLCHVGGNPVNLEPVE
jgi:hypothetical protein